MKSEEFKKFSINTRGAYFSWEKQRSEINERIFAAKRKKRKFALIHRWADVVILTVITVLAGWLIFSHDIVPKTNVAMLEEMTVEEALPSSLIVLNGFEVVNTDYTEFIDFMVPYGK